MPLSPHLVYWIGLIVACGIYLYVICRIIDGIWDMELTDTVYAIVWELVLRNVMRWVVGFYILVVTGTILIAVVFTYVDPWKSLAWFLAAIPTLRILFWLYWRLHEDADVDKDIRESRAEQRGIHGWERFITWCFCWGPYEGLMTKEEMRSYRNPSESVSLGNPVD